MDIKDLKKIVKEEIENVIENEVEVGPGGNVREILPQMVSLSNNSRITQATAQAIADKLSQSEFRDFKIWLQLIEQHR